MLRLLTSFIAVTLLALPMAHAEETKGSDFATYSVFFGFSPFGGSTSFAYNASPKTTWNVTVGSLPESDMDLNIGGTEYTVTSSSNWAGFFVNHRPINSAPWFRFVSGIGIGQIKNTLKDGDGNEYQADYRDNPVAYVGLGFGAKPNKGFIFGLDVGALYTAGPHISPVGATTNADALDEIADDLFFGAVLPNAQVTLGWGF